MNSKMKKRLAGVSGIIIIAVIVMLAFVGGNSAAQTVSVAEAAENPQVGQKIQVSGNVVSDSYETKDNVLTFSIYDPEGSSATQLQVRYDGAASSTFGNEVTAICTGKVGEDGVLECSELVTKCPSKYENAEGALTLESLLGYGDSVVGKMVKVTGTVAEGTLVAAGSDERFQLTDGANSLPVQYDEALSDEVTDGSAVVLMGSLNDQGVFQATEVALEG